MRSFLALLIVVGVFAGAIGRAASHLLPHHHASCEMVGCNVDHEDACGHDHEPVCCGSDHGHLPVDDGSDDSKAPEHHHHHHICCVTAPLVAGDETPMSFIGFDGIRTPLSVEHQSAPEGPVFELDMPPLI